MWENQNEKSTLVMIPLG